MRLQKFYEYIKEAAEWDDSAVEEMLLPIKDLGFEVRISEPQPVTDTSSHLYKKMVRSIVIWVKNKYVDELNAEVDIFNFKEGTFDRTYTSDQSIFELMAEVGNLCSRLSEDGSALSLTWQDSLIKFTILHVVDETKSSDKEIALKELFTALRGKFYRTSTDFSRHMLWEPREVEKVKDSFSIRCGGNIGVFTKRKWAAFTKGIDMSKANVSFRHDEDDEDVVIVTISIKE